jgi:hemerythrin-like domain-containing protein
MCLNLSLSNGVPVEALDRILDFIRNFVDRFHHAREETHLFPALKLVGVNDEGGALGFLREQHEMERWLLAELELAIEAYRFGDPEATRRFIEAAGRYKDHLIGHMQQEEAILFNLAEEIFDESHKASLIRVFADQAGSEFMERYEQLASELEREWAV